MATCGRQVCFHGAYKTREEAERKAEKRRGGAVLRRKIRRQVRFVVVTPKA